MENKGLSIIIFPYLFAEKSIEVEGITFKPSFPDVIKLEDPLIQKHLRNIEKLISNGIGEEIGINNYLFAILENVIEPLGQSTLKTLDKLATTLRYIGLTTSSAKYEHFNYAIFFISNPQENIENDYYQAYINGSNVIDIYTETPYSMFEVSTPVHILMDETKSKLYQHVYIYKSMYYEKDEIEEMLRSVKWFNKSFRENTAIDDQERLVNLVTSLESLFGSPIAGDIQRTVSQCIFTLLGKTEDLKAWIDQVFVKRAATIHGTGLPDVVYTDRKIKEKDAKPHIYDITYAQKIYRFCLEEILQLREKQIAFKTLKNELISNKRRLDDIKKGMDKKDITLEEMYKTAIFDSIVALNRKDTTGTKETVIKIGILLLDLTEHIYFKNKNILSIKKSICKGKEESVSLNYSNFHQEIGKFYFDFNRNDTYSKKLYLYELSALQALYEFSRYASWKLR